MLVLIFATALAVAQAPGTVGDPKAIAQRLRGDLTKSDTALGAWFNCADARIRPLYVPSEQARALAETIVRGCRRERSRMRDVLYDTLHAETPQERVEAEEFADKRVAEAEASLIDAYAEHILKLRRLIAARKDR